MEASFQAQFKKQAIANRKRETWHFKKLSTEHRQEMSLARKKEDIKRRKEARKQASVARGLTNCRKIRGQTQADFADFLGISRRALINYESGARAAGCDVLELILADGQIELNEVFGLRPEPTPIENRIEIAELTLKLLVACLAENPAGDKERVQTLVKQRVAWWPNSRRLSPQNIKKQASEIMDIIDYEIMSQESDGAADVKVK
ncbi:MAG: helix-turn-helix transcriptional regulator [Paracoccaceae bacterium]